MIDIYIYILPLIVVTKLLEIYLENEKLIFTCLKFYARYLKK